MKLNLLWIVLLIIINLIGMSITLPIFIVGLINFAKARNFTPYLFSLSLALFAFFINAATLALNIGDFVKLYSHRQVQSEKNLKT